MSESTTPITILVIEDDEAIARVIQLTLQAGGYRVLTANDGTVGLEMATHQHPDLVILDIMLPHVDGRTILKEIRSWSKMPIILLTALGSEADRILGLDAGADDYIAKPFSTRELLSRVKAVLRRTMESPLNADGTLEFDELSIQPRSHLVMKRNETIELTAKEFMLLLTLASSPNEVLSRETLLRRVWGFDYLGDSRTVDVHIGTLRRKIEDDPAAPRYIKTIWRVGYRFDPLATVNDSPIGPEDEDA